MKVFFEDSTRVFVDLTESRAGIRYCMGKAGSERFIEDYQTRRGRAA